MPSSFNSSLAAQTLFFFHKSRCIVMLRMQTLPSSHLAFRHEVGRIIKGLAHKRKGAAKTLWLCKMSNYAMKLKKKKRKNSLKCHLDLNNEIYARFLILWFHFLLVTKCKPFVLTIDIRRHQLLKVLAD